jgi:hypothetical protein
MKITAQQIQANSTQLLKQAKKIEKTEQVMNSRMAEKLHRDFASAGSNVDFIKNRIASHNNQLINHENKVSENQFIRQKIAEVKQFLAKGDNTQAWNIIESTTFNNKQVLNVMFDKNAPLSVQADYVEMLVLKNKVELDREFKKLQIASLNLSSLSAEPSMITQGRAGVELTQNPGTHLLDGKRVMDLLS